MKKTLDDKLSRLRTEPTARDFILADAKDADMAWGLASPGRGYPEEEGGRFLSMPEFLEQMREVVASGYVDILLASNSAMSVLAHREKLFESSPVTPAIRANDTTDLWISRVADYRKEPSRPFRTAHLKEAQYGSLTAETTGEPVVNLGLYSMTFNNDLDCDYANLTAFRQFREEAAACGFRYFLEVFEPNLEDCGLAKEDIPAFVNDSIIRCLAGVSRAHWPQFLKIPYFGPAAMEELAAYDPDIVVGILGGSSGTTYDAFKMLSEAKKYGARVALYGRKIKAAEHPMTMVKLLRAIADDEITAEEAVKAYHGELQKLGIKPKRDFKTDMELTATEMSYAG